MSIICSICKDNLVEIDDVYHTECAHVFHYRCLLKWLERSKTCPQCRAKVTQSSINRLHFTFSDSQTIKIKACPLQEKIENLEFQMLLKEKDIQYYISKNITLNKQNDGLKREVRKVESQLRKQNSTIYELQMEVEGCNTLKKEIAQLKMKLENLKPLEILFNAPVGDVMRMVENTKDPETLIKYISVLKKEFTESLNKRQKLCIKIKRYQDDIAKANTKNESLLGEQSKRMELEEQLAFSESRSMALQKQVEELEKRLGINETENSISGIQQVEVKNNNGEETSAGVTIITEKNNEKIQSQSLTFCKRGSKELSDYTIPKKKRKDDKIRKQSTMEDRNIIDLT